MFESPSFGNKEKIFELIEKDLLGGKQVKSADQLLTFACVLRSAVTSMKVMQKEKDLTQRMISEIVERRLSKGLQGRWRKYALDKKNKHDSSIETSDNHHISYAYLSHVKPMPMTQNTGL